MRLNEKRYDVVVSDIRLPDRDGDELFEQLQADQLYVPPWIFITGYGTIERAIALMKLGAADYVTKPFDLDKLVAKLRAHVPNAPHDERLPVLGLSPGMRRIEDMLPRLAGQTTTVLVTGQSGVGKEIVAREIHSADKLRSERPFVAVNCGGIPEQLLEAELFGYERGAFTGATRSKRGLLEQATGGTLFLDEIGDMPLTMQIKLLRVLQDRKVTRLGSEQSVTVDFRLICATHRDLKKLVEQGTFREDLYLPHQRRASAHPTVARAPRGHSLVRTALSARGCAAKWWAKQNALARRRERFARITVARERARAAPLHRASVCSYAWQRCSTLKCSLTRSRRAGSAGLAVNCAGVQRPTLSTCLEECERQYLLQELARNDWQMARTAVAIGISRKNLWERLRRLKLTAPDRALRQEMEEGDAT